MDTLKFKIIVSCPNELSSDDITRGRISIDGKKIKDIEMKGKTEGKEIEFDVSADDGPHTLTVDHTFSESSSCALVIDKIEIDEIDIGILAYNGVYTPTYPEPWYSDEVAASRPPKETIGKGEDGSACMFMGWEGKYELPFSTPLYEWLLEHL